MQALRGDGRVCERDVLLCLYREVTANAGHPTQEAPPAVSIHFYTRIIACLMMLCCMIHNSCLPVAVVYVSFNYSMYSFIEFSLYLMCLFAGFAAVVRFLSELCSCQQ